MAETAPGEDHEARQRPDRRSVNTPDINENDRPRKRQKELVVYKVSPVGSLLPIVLAVVSVVLLLLIFFLAR